MTRRKYPYEEIAEHATARYLEDYAPGERLPSENDMRVHYGVSRMTIRHARELMIKTGRFYVEQGRGMYLSRYSTADLPVDGMPDDAWVHDAARSFHRYVCQPGYVPPFKQAGPPEEWKPWASVSQEHRRHDLKVVERIIRDSLGWLIAELAAVRIDQE